MHMSDALISPAVGGVMTAASAGLLAYSVAKSKKDIDEKKASLMGAVGAFAFAAQMINFAIPQTGSSGHIVGGILLAGLLGPYLGFSTMSIILLVQTLFFADGGLLAIGCNIFNLGFYSCLVAYPLIYKNILKKELGKVRIIVASILSSIIALQLGAFSVVIQTMLSGITTLPFNTFMAYMQPIHLIIGFVEGILTATVLCIIHQMQPKIIENAMQSSKSESSFSVKRLGLAILICSLIIGGIFSLYASSQPDGLEWSLANSMGGYRIEEGSTIIHKAAQNIQDKTAIMPDYDFVSGGGLINGTSAAGILGVLLAFLISNASGLIIKNAYKRKKTVS